MIRKPEKTGFRKHRVMRGFSDIAYLHGLLCPNRHDRWGLICGGFVRWAISKKKNPQKPSDIDIFPVSEIGFEKLRIAFEKAGFEIKNENDLCLSYKKNKIVNLPVQLIKPTREARILTLGTPEQILTNFDFSIVSVALISDRLALADVYFHADDKANRLRLRNIHCPISSLLRVCKYARKGFWIPASQAIKLFADWEMRPNSYKEKIMDFFSKTEFSQEEVDMLEKLMRID